MAVHNLCMYYVNNAHHIKHRQLPRFLRGYDIYILYPPSLGQDESESIV